MNFNAWHSSLGGESAPRRQRSFRCGPHRAAFYGSLMTLREADGVDLGQTDLPAGAHGNRLRTGFPRPPFAVARSRSRFALDQGCRRQSRYARGRRIQKGRGAVALKKIRLELARDPQFPQGSNRRGYEFIAPVDAAGVLDTEAWHVHREQCRALRFWASDEPELGHLVRKPGGHWAFHYDIHGDADNDETGYRFERHRFIPGDYVSIREHDDRLRTFLVASVEDVPPHAL